MVFEDFITGYSHWGYCDLDMVLGNLPYFVEVEELEKYVTYHTALEPLPSFTLHAKSSPADLPVTTSSRTASTIWTPCTYEASGPSNATMPRRSTRSGGSAATWAPSCRRS